MVSLFGQVWLWSLLSFVAGVLLTWLVLVRPAKNRVDELEDQLADARRRSRPAPVASSSSSPAEPLPDGDFDDWHVESRSLVDEVLTPEYTGPPAQPYAPPRPPEPAYDVVPPAVVAPPPVFENLAAYEPYVEPQVAYEPAPEPEPEPEPDYDELPPALTRIDAPKPEQPAEAHEDERPRSLFERLSPDVEPSAPVVEYQQSGLVSSDLEADLPVEETQFLTPVSQPPVAEIAPVQDEPTAPPEVEMFQPVEVWREQPEPEPIAEVERVHEDELVQEEVPAVEQTAFISAAEVERILAAEDAAQAWPDRDLTGEYPIITEEIESSSGQLAEEAAEADEVVETVEVVEVVEEPEVVEEAEVVEEPVEEVAEVEEVPEPEEIPEPVAEVVEEPPAPVTPLPAPAPAPVVDRPRSLFEPIVDADVDAPTPAEQPRAMQPLSDQPFVPVLAPELLEAEKGNGLPQRPQRAPGSVRQSPAPLSAKPASPPPPPEPPRPVRPRPVGFSPSTGGRAPANGSPRFQQSEGFNPRSPFGPGSVLPKSDGLAPAADFEVKATLTGRRYYTSESANFRETRADVWFRTVSDAQKAGFRQAP